MRLRASLAETTLGRELRAVEHGALDAALAAAETTLVPTIPDVIAALITPDDDAARTDGSTATERTADGRDLAHGLRRLVLGRLAKYRDWTSPACSASSRLSDAHFGLLMGLAHAAE